VAWAVWISELSDAALRRRINYGVIRRFATDQLGSFERPETGRSTRRKSKATQRPREQSRGFFFFPLLLGERAAQRRGEDMRYRNHGLAPKSAADFAFLLHGFHYLKDDGVMAVILPHGVLFRGGAEARIRKKLLLDGHIDTVIGLPANLFYSTGIPDCVVVLKKCKRPDDVLIINAAEHFEKGKRQNRLLPEHIDKIVSTYRERRAKHAMPAAWAWTRSKTRFAKQSGGTTRFWTN
jgi:hypothetical protein